MEWDRIAEREGFSLIELIIVITIIAILVGGATLSFNLVRSTDTKGAAHDIDSGLTELKSENMGGSKLRYMHLYRHNGKVYIDYTDSDNSDHSYVPAGAGKEIGDSSLRISCDGISLAEDAVVTIGIQKKDGAFSLGPEEILVESDGVTAYVVYLIKDTGKHYVEAK